MGRKAIHRLAHGIVHILSAQFIVLPAALVFSPATAAAAECKPVLDLNTLKPTVDRWNKFPDTIPLGEFTVIRDRFDANKRIINSASYERIQAAEAAGFVAIKKSSQGEKIKIRVTPTDRGVDLINQSKKLNPALGEGILGIPIGSFELAEIKRSAQFDKGWFRLGMISFTYRTSWTPSYQKYMKKLESVIGTESIKSRYCMADLDGQSDRKARVALRFDEFKCTWQPIAFDLADIDLDFCSHNVDSILKQ